MGIVIKDASHLKELMKDRETLDCFVLLNGGMRSSKTIVNMQNSGFVRLIHDGETGFGVINEIDDTYESFGSLEELVQKHETIRKALEKCAFLVYDYEVLK